MTLIALITKQRAERLRQNTKQQQIALRFKISGTNEEIMTVMQNPFYQPEDTKDIKRKIGKAFKRSTKALGEVMSEVGASSDSPLLEALGEHTVAQSKRMNKKKNDTPYSVMASSLKTS
jgi:hypothetical protein